MKRAIVAVVRCESYEQPIVDAAVTQGMALLGDSQHYLKQKGERLLLKPNVLWGRDPDECVTTHPSVFKAVAKYFQTLGASLQYGDSPAGITGTGSALKKAGIADIAEQLNIGAADFDKGSMVDFDKGVTSKKLFIANAIAQCDGVISLPKLKTHGLTRMTGAVKNQFGCVPGITKGEYHARFPDVYDFSQLIVDITRYVAPRLYVMDAVYAMEGNGPQSGTPKKLGILLLSSDPVALDTVASKIINLDPSFVPTIKAGVDSGLGVSDDTMIEIRGEPLERCIDRSFDVVRQMPVRVPRNRIHLELRNHFIKRPVADAKLCIRCGRCVLACPVDPKAVSLPKGKPRPLYNYRNCIRCFCCQEVCPAKAITIQSGILKKLFPFAGYFALFLSNIIVKGRKKVSR